MGRESFEEALDNDCGAPREKEKAREEAPGKRGGKFHDDAEAC